MATTDREFVRQHYPESRAEWVPAAKPSESGQFARGYWSIFATADREHPSMLGLGETREQAWADAATRLRTPALS